MPERIFSSAILRRAHHLRLENGRGALKDFAEGLGLKPKSLYVARSRQSSLERGEAREKTVKLENRLIEQLVWEGLRPVQIAEALGWKGERLSARIHERLKYMGLDRQERIELQKTNPRIQHLLNELERLNQRNRKRTFQLTPEVRAIVRELFSTSEFGYKEMARILGCPVHSLAEGMSRTSRSKTTSAT